MFYLTFAGDESGDVSFAFDKGASSHFVVVILAAPEHTLSTFLHDLRMRLGLSASYEFSFHTLSSTSLRRRVFADLAQTDFEAWAVIVEKKNLPDTFRVMRPFEFYLYFVSEVIRLIPAKKREGATLLLDEFGSPKQLPVELRRVLKTRSIPRHFKQMQAKRSKSEPLIQMADLVAGAILRHVAKGESEAYATIEKKLHQVEKFEG